MGEAERGQRRLRGGRSSKPRALLVAARASGGTPWRPKSNRTPRRSTSTGTPARRAGAGAHHGCGAGGRVSMPLARRCRGGISRLTPASTSRWSGAGGAWNATGRGRRWAMPQRGERGRQGGRGTVCRRAWSCAHRSLRRGYPAGTKPCGQVRRDESVLLSCPRGIS
jgi:hypothetical protein